MSQAILDFEKALANLPAAAQEWEQPEQGESDLERRQNAARQRDRQAYYEKGRADGERAASQPAEPVE